MMLIEVWCSLRGFKDEKRYLKIKGVSRGTNGYSDIQDVTEDELR